MKTRNPPGGGTPDGLEDTGSGRTAATSTKSSQPNPEPKADTEGNDYGFVTIPRPEVRRSKNRKCISCGSVECRGLMGCRFEAWIPTRPQPKPKPEPVAADASNRLLVEYLKMSLDPKGWEAAHPELAANTRLHPDYDGPYRSSTWDELVTDSGWTDAKWIMAAHRLACELNLISSSPQEDEMRQEHDGSSLGARDKNKFPKHIKVAQVYIALMETDNRLRRFNDVEGRSLHLWKYEGGLWSWLPDRAVAKWLTPQLQQIFNTFVGEHKSTVRHLNEAVQHVIRHEKVCIDSDAMFDQHGKVPTRDGLIDPITHEIEPLKPEHFATWVLPKVRYDPNATCRHWEQMLNDALADKSEDERVLDIQLIQDFAGASLLDAKPKDLQRGLVLLGPGDTGKSSLQQVLAGMLSDRWITTPISNLSGPHGTQAFLKRAPWVLGEAFTTSVWHLADTVKMILGGDSIEINPKNKDAISIKPKTPAIWATNHEPKFKEPTRSIVERLIVMRLTRVFDKTKPIGVAAAAKKFNPGWWPHDLVLNTERSGVLNWMLVGAKRALERGCYINTKAGEELLEGILDDSNVVRAFAKDCIEFDPAVMISTPDFMLTLVHWWQEHYGDEAKPPNATLIGVHLKALADPRILQDKDLFKNDNGLRFYLGIKLNKAGEDHWLEAFLSDNQSGRFSNRRTSTSLTEVERTISPEWLKLPEVVRMKKAHKEARKPGPKPKF